MTEFVGDHALQLLPLQALDRAASNSDHGILLVQTGRKRIDARFVFQKIDLWDPQTSGNRQLLDDVDEPLSGGIGAVGGDSRAAERSRHPSAASVGESKPRVNRGGAD